MTRADIIKRADELKDIAKKARSRNEEVLVDLRIKPAGNATKSPTQSLKSNELPIKKGVNAPTVGEPANTARKGVSLGSRFKESKNILDEGVIKEDGSIDIKKAKEQLDYIKGRRKELIDM